MADHLDAVRGDIAALSAVLANDARLREFVAEHRDIVADEDDARSYIKGILAALDDVLHGRTIAHEEVVRLSEKRRRQSRPDAAE